jgi:undecaprenyl-diphosphatase
MEIFEIIKAFILGVVQGITEWLPISSTGHLILVENLLKFNLSEAFVKTFFVVIQFGSILAVVVLFFPILNPIKKDKKERNKILNLWFKIAIASIPTGLIGVLFADEIDSLLYTPFVVALMLIIYGVIFIVLERGHRRPNIDDLEQISYKLALGIGFFQMLSLIPGTSRSGATIVGAVFLGTSRYIASEFSFFLAIPVMFAASGFKLIESGLNFSGLEFMVLLVGFMTAFIVSMWAINFLLNYIRKYDFKIFGYYRIALGLIVLLVYFLI